MAGAAPPVYRGTGAWGVPDTGYAGGIQPHGWEGGVRVQPGWVGGVRVGYQAPGAPPAGPAAPWQPTGYNPELDIKEAEGKQGTEQALTSLSRQRTDQENAFGTKLGVLGEREANEAARHQETLKLLAESFAKLGGRQGEAANRLGVVNGGALIASATRRAANEGVQRAAQERAYAEQRQADENARGALSTEKAQLLGPGGSLTEAVANAERNRQLFEQGITTLKDKEAVQNGYGPIKWSRNPLVRAIQAKRGW